MRWGEHVGVAFQATDDLSDLVTAPSVTGKDGLRDLLDHDPVIAELRARLEAQVAEGFLSPTEAAEQVLTRFRTGGAPRP